MSTIVDKLNLLLENKNAIKAVLEEKGKEPSDVLSTYAQSISELDNEEQVSYVLSNADGSKKIYAQLSSKEPITLTATENDIRLGSTAITNEGFVEGVKDIPSYHTEQGVRLIPANSQFKMTFQDGQYDYTKLQAMLAPYNTSLAKSVAVDRVVIEDNVYNTESTEAVSSIVRDDENMAIDLAITNGSSPYVIRYMTYRKED